MSDGHGRPAGAGRGTEAGPAEAAAANRAAGGNAAGAAGAAAPGTAETAQTGTTVPRGTQTLRTVAIERRLDATPDRVIRCWTDPDELMRWFPIRVDGSLAVGARTTLVWPREQVWWEVTDLVTPSRFAFRWPWDADETLVTNVTVALEAEGSGTRILLTDGPFPIDRPGGLDAWAEALEGWGEALTLLRGYVDFSVDLRDRP
jgi:uncharacterized protein YndB with AHSA1/START domain